MPRTAVPTPLAAVVGLVPAVLSGVCHLPARALRLPALALSSAFGLVGAARQEYDDLAVRGEQLYSRFRGQRLGQVFDAVEDRAEDLIDQTPFAKAYATVEDVAETVRDRVAGEQPGSNRPERDQPGRDDQGAADDRATGEPEGDSPVEVPEDEQPKGAPTPKAPQNQGGPNGGDQAGSGRSSGPAESAASPGVVELVQEIVAELAVGNVPSPVLAHGDLPLPGYDQLTLGSLRGRLRVLDVVQLVQLRDYEKSHANRLPVVTMLDNRIAKLATPGATPVAVPGDSGSNGSTRSG